MWESARISRKKPHSDKRTYQDLATSSNNRGPKRIYNSIRLGLSSRRSGSRPAIYQDCTAMNYKDHL